MTPTTDVPEPIYTAAALDEVNAWVAQWGTELQILGIAFLGLCAVALGMKQGAKSVVSGGAGGGQRETVGAVFGLVIAGVLIGAALILVPIFVRAGENSGTTTPAPAPAAAASVVGPA